MLYNLYQTESTINLFRSWSPVNQSEPQFWYICECFYNCFLLGVKLVLCLTPLPKDFSSYTIFPRELFIQLIRAMFLKKKNIFVNNKNYKILITSKNFCWKYKKFETFSAILEKFIFLLGAKFWWLDQYSPFRTLTFLLVVLDQEGLKGYTILHEQGDPNTTTTFTGKSTIDCGKRYCPWFINEKQKFNIGRYTYISLLQVERTLDRHRGCILKL